MSFFLLEHVQQRSLIGGRLPATMPPTAEETESPGGGDDDGSSTNNSSSISSSSGSLAQFPSGPTVVSAFSSWVKGPLVEFCQVEE